MTSFLAAADEKPAASGDVENKPAAVASSTGSTSGPDAGSTQTLLDDIAAQKQRMLQEFLLQQHGISDSVLMPGYSNNVASLLRKVDLLVMPSLTEGLPITLLEAMAIETPVLVSSVGEMPSVLGFGRGGNIVETRADSVLLARAITDALNCETLTQKTEWAAKAVLEKFSSESMAKQYLELYRGL